MKLKVKRWYRYSDLYCLCLLLWEFVSVLTSSNLNDSLSSFLYLTHRGISLLTLVLVIFGFFRGIRNVQSSMKMIYAVALFVAGALSFYYSGRDEIFMASVFIIGAYNLELNKVLSSMLKGLSLGLTTVISLSIVNVIDIGEIVAVRNTGSVTRYSMGFVHPNTLAILLLELILLLLVLKFKELKLRQITVLFILSFVCYKITYSRTALICGLLTLAIAMILKIARKLGLEKSWLFITRNVVKVFLLVAIFGTVYVVWNYPSVSKIVNVVTDIIGGRIQLLNEAIQLYPINYFGQSVSLVSSAEYFEAMGDSVVLDNSYVYMLLEFGIVPTTLLLFGYLANIRLAYKKQDALFLICIICYIAVGFTEKYFSGLSYNFTLLMVSNYIYCKSNDVREFKRQLEGC